MLRKTGKRARYKARYMPWESIHKNGTVPSHVTCAVHAKRKFMSATTSHMVSHHHHVCCGTEGMGCACMHKACQRALMRASAAAVRPKPKNCPNPQSLSVPCLPFFFSSFFLFWEPNVHGRCRGNASSPFHATFLLNQPPKMPETSVPKSVLVCLYSLSACLANASPCLVFLPVVLLTTRVGMPAEKEKGSLRGGVTFREPRKAYAR